MSDRPDRPEHDDFWLLARLVQDFDAQADAGMKFTDIVGRTVDPASLLYLAEQRALRMQNAGLERLETLYIDAFLLGTAYQAAKDRGQTA